MGKKRQGKKERQIGRERKRESKDEGERKRIREKGTDKRELEKVNKGRRKGMVKVKCKNRKRRESGRERI